MSVQNFIELSAAVHELSRSQRKENCDENREDNYYQSFNKTVNEKSAAYFTEWDVGADTAPKTAPKYPPPLPHVHRTYHYRHERGAEIVAFTRTVREMNTCALLLLMLQVHAQLHALTARTLAVLAPLHLPGLPAGDAPQSAAAAVNGFPDAAGVADSLRTARRQRALADSTVLTTDRSLSRR